MGNEIKVDVLNSSILTGRQIHSLAVAFIAIIRRLLNPHSFILELCDKVSAACDGHSQSLGREKVDPDTQAHRDLDHVRTIAFGRLRDKVKADLKAAGYNGEKVVVLVASDFPTLKAMTDVGVDFLQKAGLNVEYQAMDWGTVLKRRASKDPIDKGGWNVFFTAWAGTDMLNPAGHLSLRGNGEPGWFGWPTSPEIERLLNAWFDAPDIATQKKLCEDIQKQVFVDVPYVPLGQYLQATAYRDSLTGVNNGFAMFWNVRRV